MKINLKLLALLTLVLLTFSSCKKDEDEIAPYDLTGTSWFGTFNHGTTVYNDFRLEFQPAGKLLVSGGNFAIRSGTWEKAVTAKRVTMQWVEGDITWEGSGELTPINSKTITGSVEKKQTRTTGTFYIARE